MTGMSQPRLELAAQLSVCATAAKPHFLAPDYSHVYAAVPPVGFWFKSLCF
jgi:hypothetical protein